MWKQLRRLSAMLAVLVMLFSASAALAAKDDALNLLLIGVDSQNADIAGRSDTMMLVRVDPGAGTLRMVSFLRDLYVAIPGRGKTRLNAAYFYGGEALLKETLQQNFGVRVDRTATVHFSVLADLIDQIGGIEVDLLSAELPYLNQLLRDSGQEDLTVNEAGLQPLNGIQALCYSRIRKLDSDFQRTSRQQTVIAAMLQKLSAQSKWDLMRLALGNLGKVETDITFTDITRLVPLAGRLDELDLQTARVPFEGAYSEATIDDMMVLVPDLAACQTQLQAFLD